MLATLCVCLLLLGTAQAAVFAERLTPEEKAAFLASRGSFDEYMLTRIQPNAVCRADDDAVPDTCVIPPGSPIWSVHGLWPERKNGGFPQFCDGVPKHFDPSLIKEIEAKLNSVWINTIPSKSASEFWKHEYEKHGTCAQKDPKFKTEFMYFNNTIELNRRFDVEAALTKGGITARRTPYETETVQKALNDHLANGKYVQLHCLKDKKTGDTLFADVRLCLDLEWNPVDCPNQAIAVPHTEIVGQGLPLPTFTPCKGPIVVIDADLEKTNKKFDEYMLTRIYPSAVCRADDDTVPDSCEVPKGTPSWTIHGLWPENSDGSYPQFCPGKPRRFDPKLIESIREKLSRNWPNLFPNKEEADFWKHEYEKHGTCAQVDFRFGSELKYFNTSMYLNDIFNVQNALQTGAIIPRDEPYDATEVQRVLNEQLGHGKYVQMNCLKDKKTGKTLLADTRLCLNLEFHIVDCPKQDKISTQKAANGYPLPTFKPCDGKITFLSNDGYKINFEMAVKKVKIMYYINPLIDIFIANAIYSPAVVHISMITVGCIIIFMFYKLNSNYYISIPRQN